MDFFALDQACQALLSVSVMFEYIAVNSVTWDWNN